MPPVVFVSPDLTSVMPAYALLATIYSSIFCLFYGGRLENMRVCKPIASLQGLRPNGNIVYSGTFSKILSPALRLSYMVLPYSLLAKYRELFRAYFPSVSLLGQRTMAHFMEQGHWERHIRRMRISYKRNTIFCCDRLILILAHGLLLSAKAPDSMLF